MIETAANEYAILVQDGIPVLMRVEADGNGKIVMSPEKQQPPLEELGPIIEAQGGLHKPYGIFRYDPDLARAGLRNCTNCGDIIQVRSSTKDPSFIPVKCNRCQAPMRSARKPQTP